MREERRKAINVFWNIQLLFSSCWVSWPPAKGHMECSAHGQQTVSSKKAIWLFMDSPEDLGILTLSSVYYIFHCLHLAPPSQLLSQDFSTSPLSHSATKVGWSWGEQVPSDANYELTVVLGPWLCKNILRTWMLDSGGWVAKSLRMIRRTNILIYFTSNILVCLSPTKNAIHKD